MGRKETGKPCFTDLMCLAAQSFDEIQIIFSKLFGNPI